jgi:hypothetical protein
VQGRRRASHRLPGCLAIRYDTVRYTVNLVVPRPWSDCVNATDSALKHHRTFSTPTEHLSVKHSAMASEQWPGAAADGSTPHGLQPQPLPQQPSAHEDQLDRQMLRHLMRKYTTEGLARLMQEEETTTSSNPSRTSVLCNHMLSYMECVDMKMNGNVPRSHHHCVHFARDPPSVRIPQKFGCRQLCDSYRVVLTF